MKTDSVAEGYTIHVHRDDRQSVRPWHWWIEGPGGTITPGGREWSEVDATNTARDILGQYLSAKAAA